MDAESYIQSLLVSNPLRESTLRAMIRALQLPKGSRGLDAGCGIGLQCLLLADEVGLTGHVTGLDVSAIEQSSRMCSRSNKSLNRYLVTMTSE